MRVLLLFCLLGLVACQSLQAPSALPAWQSPQAREHAQLGHIIELRTGRLLTPAQLLEALASTPLLLVIFSATLLRLARVSALIHIS